MRRLAQCHALSLLLVVGCCGGLGLIPGLAPSARSPSFPPVTPALHAHNDYLHPRPLLDALDARARSVEADIFVVAGDLLVAHTPIEIRPGRTLEHLYLAPLLSLVNQQQTILKDGQTFFLLVDLKSPADETFPVLLGQLKKYRSMLSHRDAEGVFRPGPVTVIITGNQPPRDTWDTPGERLVFFDGSLSDLDAESPLSNTLVPVISSNWKRSFRWTGTNPQEPIPAAESARLNSLVGKAHVQGKLIRFWGAPDHPDAWKALLDSGADLINTDKLPEAAAFLTERRKASSSPSTQSVK